MKKKFFAVLFAVFIVGAFVFFAGCNAEMKASHSFLSSFSNQNITDAGTSSIAAGNNHKSGGFIDVKNVGGYNKKGGVFFDGAGNAANKESGGFSDTENVGGYGKKSGVGFFDEVRDAVSKKGGGLFDDVKNFLEKLNPKQKNETQSARELYREDVYLGGLPIGISLTTDGLIVTGKNDIITKTGVVSPSAKSNIMNGDVLLFINDKKIEKPDDIAAALKDNRGEDVILKLRRGKIDFVERVGPAEDSLTGARRLGLIVKTDLMGIGTLTFVKNDGRYGALGHRIADAETGIKDLNQGDIYQCSIIGIVKGERNKAGELRGLINKSGGSYGTIDKNNQFGIFGEAKDVLTGKLEKISVGGKYAVTPGKAFIRTTIAGETPRLYEIEIVKTNFQGNKSEKGMVIRVTDENLLAVTGGILQGMSGSPIIQDGKLVGAVTHVFVNDPSKGYGMYIDFMLNE
jgi:stage IV sporulation protein B